MIRYDTIRYDTTRTKKLDAGETARGRASHAAVVQNHRTRRHNATAAPL